MLILLYTSCVLCGSITGFRRRDADGGDRPGRPKSYDWGGMKNLAFSNPGGLAYNQRVPELSAESINASTRCCAVLGHPVRHSASPAMHNAALAALGLDWRYLAFEVHPRDLPAAFAGARAMKFAGLNLTVPHKTAALKLADVVHEKARLLGAVNTIVFETPGPKGDWIPLGRVADQDVGPIRSHAYNTDAEGLARSLKEEFQGPDLRGASVLLLGAGGAARAAALQLAEEGVARLFLVNRTADRAGEIAAAVAARFPTVNINQSLPDGPVDLVINATSLGLKPDDPPPVSEDWLNSRRPRRVYDMIYRPAETALLRAAKKAGCQTANGLGMLLYQGAAALELWSGAPAPIEIMRAALRQHIYG
jgi:shikimate dehydrogenase